MDGGLDAQNTEHHNIKMMLLISISVNLYANIIVNNLQIGLICFILSNKLLLK